MRRALLALLCVACATTQPAPIHQKKIEQDKTAQCPEDGAACPRKKITITIDDLPWVGGLTPNDTQRAATGRLLQTLQEHRVPAFGFVTCKNISPGEDLLSLWMKADFSLGNHTQSHRAIDDMPLEDWLADVTKCEETLSGITKKPTQWFRYPQLRSGKTLELRDAGQAALLKMGYKIGHVTVDTSEWMLTIAYQKALAANDKDKAQKVVDAYQRHMLDAVHHYEAVAKEKLGREIPQVLLLHANALEADHLGLVLDALQKEGYEFISFDEAMRDPVYQLPDAYVGVWGVSWLNRIAPVAEDAA